MKEVRWMEYPRVAGRALGNPYVFNFDHYGSLWEKNAKRLFADRTCLQIIDFGKSGEFINFVLGPTNETASLTMCIVFLINTVDALSECLEACQDYELRVM